MDDIEILVNWRAAIFHTDKKRPIYGYLIKIGKGKALVKTDHNLPPGNKCNFAALLPKNTYGEPTQYVEGFGVVEYSVLSSAQFRVSLHSLEIQGDGKQLLNDYFQRHRDARKERN